MCHLGFPNAAHLKRMIKARGTQHTIEAAREQLHSCLTACNIKLEKIHKFWLNFTFHGFLVREILPEAISIPEKDMYVAYSF